MKTCTGSPTSKLNGTKSFSGSPRLGFENRTEICGAPSSNGFLAEKPQFALIHQRETKSPKLHHELVPVGPNRERPVRGMLVSSRHLAHRKVERDGRDILQRWQRFFESLVSQSSGSSPRRRS